VPTLVRRFGKRAQAVPPVRTPVEEDESALIASAKNGEGQAFEVLVARHQRRILAIALRYTRVQQDAEDIMQQSFQKAFFHLHQFEGRSSFSTWLTRVAINEAQMLQRKKWWLARSVDRRPKRECGNRNSAGDPRSGSESRNYLLTTRVEANAVFCLAWAAAQNAEGNRVARAR